MFKLTALLCAAMFAVLLIAGEDRGQLRPGLANVPTAEPAAEATRVTVAVAPAPVAAPDAAPAEVAPVSAPVTVAAVPEETVFSLATYSADAPQDTAQPASTASSADAVAYVDAASVNVREGPGTGNPVLTRLTRGEAVTIVSTDDTGWARIRLEGDGLEGFMSMEYLSATAP